MGQTLQIRPLEYPDIYKVTKWAREEGFAPGTDDVSIYRSTDNQGLWVGCINSEPIGCISGVRYNSFYGFIGLFLVVPEQRGRGYGVELWKRALDHLNDLPCIGLEAALERVNDYSSWGFAESSPTTRWKLEGNGDIYPSLEKSQDIHGGELHLLEGAAIPNAAVQAYDAKREPSPRPHFLGYWLNHASGKVLALVDSMGACHGFGRIRPCLLREGKGWRIGPLLADTTDLAELLLKRLIEQHPGTVLLDSPGLNNNVESLLVNLGFEKTTKTIRMYKGKQPPISMNNVYALACLELG